MFQGLVENAKAIGAVLACCTGVGTGYVALDGPIPASQKYVIAQTDNLKNRVIDNQLQLNTVQRNLLRKEKFDREIELQKDPASPVSSILRQRLDVITDDLDNIDKERDELRKEKAQK